MAYGFGVISRSQTFVPRFPLLLGGGLATIGVLTGIAVDEGPVLCMFRRCTGGYCPGCGGTRALRAMVMGDLNEAWKLHPWSVLIVIQMIMIGLAATVVSVSTITSMFKPFVVFNAAIGVLIWILRIGVGAVPVPFS